ncbi:hypothetical protein HRbin02_00134 [Candidatus Calditenuaceae archaeon HR02]|nr:hypothetical protein HRbin02_00134 [Candidatus Calditenuaceae archaeon HR02]
MAYAILGVIVVGSRVKGITRIVMIGCGIGICVGAMSGASMIRLEHCFTTPGQVY